VAWDRMAATEQVRQAARAVRLLHERFPKESHEARNWGACRALQPHADHAAGLAALHQVVLELVVDLLDRMGVFDRHRARFTEAERRHRKALELAEAAYGPDHPAVVTTLGNLGIVARQQGDLAGARALLERALGIEEATYGPDHPEVARTLGNLGL